MNTHLRRGLVTLRRAARVGPRGLVQRVARRTYEASGAADLRFNLRIEDVLTGIPDALPMPSDPVPAGEPISVGWIITPPAPGSGGHTTIFRMVEALEKRGHRCTLFVYDRHGLDAASLTERIRRHWPRVVAEVRDASRGIRDVDVAVATAWETAHVLVKHGTVPMSRAYFIQDFEPYFYGHGAQYEFAAMTYRLPLRRIVLGDMLDGMIREATGLNSTVIPFGCDSEAYRLPPAGTARSGIVFYSRRDDARRGYELACVALTEFHRTHPEQEIHVYGEAPRGLDVPHTFHGWVSAAELNDLYGRTIAGLALSFTNITLVAEEMLAAGNIPVVNDVPLAHEILKSPSIRWAEATAQSLASALGDAITASDVDGDAERAAASVRGRSWTPTYDAFVDVIEELGHVSEGKR